MFLINIFSRIQFVSRLSQLTDVRLPAHALARSKKIIRQQKFLFTRAASFCKSCLKRGQTSFMFMSLARAGTDLVFVYLYFQNLSLILMYKNSEKINYFKPATHASRACSSLGALCSFISANQIVNWRNHLFYPS